MTIPAQILDFNELALARLVDQYKQSTNIKKVIQIFADDFLFNIEDVLHKMHDELANLIANDIKGVQLDTLGEFLGQERPTDISSSSTLYREVLRRKVLALDGNGSGGLQGETSDVSTILDVVNDLFDSPALVSLLEIFPAAIQLFRADLTTAEAELMFRLAIVAKAPGVRLLMRWTETGSGDQFTFDSASPNGLDDGALGGCIGS